MNWFKALQDMNKKISETNIPETVGNYADWVEAKAKEEADAAKAAAANAAGDVKDTVSGYAGYVSDKANGAINTANNIKNTVTDTVNTVKDTVSDVKTVASGGLDGLSGYADYIENGAPGKTNYSTPTEPTAPSAPAPETPTPETPTPETPTPEAPTPETPSAPAPDLTAGAMSYADYVTKTGGDPAADAEAAKKQAQENYNKTVLDASREYDRARAAYGAEGEAMARAGLGGSGYADYLDAQAYAARQGSLDSARDTRQSALDLADANQKNAERELQKGYLDYIENYKSGQKADFNSAMNYLINGNLSGDQARSYLEMMGLGSQADSILAITDPIVQKNLSGESHAQASKWLDDTLSKGYTGQDAYDHAKFLGASDEEAAYIQRMADAQANNANAGADDANRSAAYNAVVSAGATTEEEAYNIVKQYIKDDKLAKQIAKDAVTTSSRLKSELASEDAETRRQSAIQMLVATGITEKEDLAEVLSGWGLTDEKEIAQVVAAASSINKRREDINNATEAKSDAEKKRANELLALEHLVEEEIIDTEDENISGDILKIYGITGEDAKRVAAAAKNIIEKRQAGESSAKSEMLTANMGSVFSDAIGMGMTPDEAKTHATELGYTEEQASTISGLVESYYRDIDESENTEIRLEAMENVLSMGLRGDAAEALVESLAKAKGLTDEKASALAKEIVGETDNIIAAKSAEELKTSLPNFMAAVISNGWDEDTARNIARAAGYDEDAVTEIMGIAELNSSGMSEDMASALSSVLTYGLTGQDATNFIKDMYGLSDRDAKKVVEHSDKILANAAVSADDADEDITVDFSKTGGNIASMAYVLRGAKEIGHEDDLASNYIDNYYNANDEGELEAAKEGYEALISYWTRKWKGLGYTADQINHMIELIEEQESTIAYG